MKVLEKNPDEIEFICPSCKTKELIPLSIVEMLDASDPGDTSYPPRFDCDNCNGKMEPTYYISVDGIVFKN